jgi:hypothetical protein
VGELILAVCRMTTLCSSPRDALETETLALPESRVGGLTPPAARALQVRLQWQLRETLGSGGAAAAEAGFVFPSQPFNVSMQLMELGAQGCAWCTVGDGNTTTVDTLNVTMQPLEDRAMQVQLNRAVTAPKDSHARLATTPGSPPHALRLRHPPAGLAQVLLPAPAVDTTTRRLNMLLDAEGSITAADVSAAFNFSVEFRMCFPEVAPDLTPGALFAQPGTLDAAGLASVNQPVGWDGELCLTPDHAHFLEPGSTQRTLGNATATHFRFTFNVSNAGLVPAELAEGATAWVSQWLWDGEVVATWASEEGMANNATTAHEAMLSLGQPDDAAHTLTLVS